MTENTGPYVFHFTNDIATILKGIDTVFRSRLETDTDILNNIPDKNFECVYPFRCTNIDIIENTPKKHLVKNFYTSSPHHSYSKAEHIP